MPIFVSQRARRCVTLAVIVFSSLQLLSFEQPLTAAAIQSVAVPTRLAVRKALAPPPRGVTELRFADLYKNPVGPAGLELSEQALALNGKRVRIIGFMVAQETPIPGAFMLAPLPSAISDHDEGLADDLPPSTVFVHLPSAPEALLPNLEGLIQLHGTLSVGAETERHSDRISTIRLLLDKPPERSLLKLRQKPLHKPRHDH